MKLLLELIRDNLEQEDLPLFVKHSAEGIHEKEELSACPRRQTGWYGAVQYQQEEDVQTIEKEFLLFGRAEDFPDALAGRGILSVGKPSGEVLEKNEVLYCEKPLSQQEALKFFRALQGLFLHFEKWEESLKNLMRNGQRMEELLQHAYRIFENPVFVHDENFNLMASVNEGEGQHAWYFDESSGKYILPMDILNDFNVNPDYLESMLTNGPAMFPAETFGYRILYQNLRYGSQYRGRICVNELNRNLRESDYYLLDYFSDILTDIFKSGQTVEYHKKYSLSGCLKKLIRQEDISEKELDMLLIQYGWTIHDHYFCAYLVPEEGDVRINSLLYYSNQISEQISDVCVFPYGHTIVVVSNNTLNGLEPADFRRRIGLLLRESLMKAGISCICGDLSGLYYMYRQAVCALEVGKRRQGTFWCFCFEDYKTDYIFHNALKDFPAQYLECREISTLKEYDKSHTSGLFLTLKYYLENDRNLARTSEQLNIHRTTLLYRLDRIKKLIGSDLQDPEERFRLWASIRLLEEARE